MCDCWECQMEAMGLDPNDPADVDRGGEMIARYMLANNCSFPEAVEALVAQRRQSYAEVAKIYGKRHGLSREAVDAALWRHGINGPAVLQ